MADVEALARAIRDAVLIGPMGPNSRAVHAGGGMVSLTGSEASDAARALLDSDWLAAHDAATRADERALVLGEVADPIIRYADLGDGEELDEFIAKNASIHVEGMGKTSWWIGVTLADGRMWHINLGAFNERAKFYAMCEEDA